MADDFIINYCVVLNFCNLKTGSTRHKKFEDITIDDFTERAVKAINENAFAIYIDKKRTKIIKNRHACYFDLEVKFDVHPGYEFVRTGNI